MKPFDLTECIKNGGYAVDKSGNKYNFVEVVLATASLKFIQNDEYTYYYYLDGRLNCQEIIPEDMTLYLPEPGDEYEPFDIAKYVTGEYEIRMRCGYCVSNLAISTGNYPIETMINGSAERYRLDGTYCDEPNHYMDLVLRKK